MKRIVLVTNIPTPYRIPLFNELHRQLNEAGCELIVIFGRNTYERRKWVVDLSGCAFNYYILQSKVIGSSSNNELTTFTFSGLARMLMRLNPDLVIAPGFSLATMKIWMLSVLRNFEFVIWTGSVEQNAMYTSIMRVAQRKLLVKKASSFVVYGTAARTYIERLGGKASAIFTGINTVDTTYFREQTNALRIAQPASRVKYLTYIGYLSKRKNVAGLLNVILKLARKRDDFILEVIGDGEDLPALKSLVHKQGAESRIVFHGYQQKEALPPFLARSNGFLFQTAFDIWGLVLNEAMAAGVPCVASKQAGAVQDLLQDNANGIVIDFANQTMLLEKIEWLLDNPDKGRAMGKKAQQFIDEHATLAHSAEGFLRAIQYSLKRPMIPA